MAEGWTVPRLWDGERCWIISGGQSVPRDFLANHRPPGRILVVKDGALLFPDADCMFYGDPHDMHKQRPEIFSAYRGPLTVKRTVHDGIPAHVKQVRRAMADKNRINGLSLEPHLLGGHDSGGSAINLAFHLGVSQIVLVGFDYRGHHWNTLHPFPRSKMRAHDLHRVSVDAMAKPLRQAGVRVLNASSISNLTEYARVDLAQTY